MNVNREVMMNKRTFLSKAVTALVAAPVAVAAGVETEPCSTLADAPSVAYGGSAEYQNGHERTLEDKRGEFLHDIQWGSGDEIRTGIEWKQQWLKVYNDKIVSYYDYSCRVYSVYLNYFLPSNIVRHIERKATLTRLEAAKPNLTDDEWSIVDLWIRINAIHQKANLKAKDDLMKTAVELFDLD